MTLITDGGSTKCDWILLNSSGEILFKTRTEGLNPAVIPQEELYNRIVANSQLQNVFKEVTQLDFYGAGCGTETPKKLLAEILQELFESATVVVQEDLTAAVYAATTQPGIVCILGTGSNSCYFDGSKIHTPIPALGYSLMDEASGNYFGKKLITDYYYGRMPKQIATQFEQEFNLNADEIKLNIYKKPNPNAYLASFAQFIFSASELNDYFYQLIKKGIEEFIECRILTFPEATKVPIHFIGSIAHFSETIIRDCFRTHNLELGNIVRRPIDGLINYYKENKLNH
ncbi:N-acetylglucosamine kinase-like BadF-type ATPase [Ulvibacter sp. MAR_2010_11]|uniref:N-acetylglucosamine kinase n=1 Tax=Ulvibacter sp. MAR_2010_11 TaxID=1250229 RepID=UPI000C2CC9E2|nr:N-acetylglucosamine kinase [Ulvibacter sp. MAR_2010_11]PKA84441.1 N-acetylglucosamine kinase-like BadF-type ATPase [Ulvibacter sp. MAR_2010_11]